MIAEPSPANALEEDFLFRFLAVGSVKLERKYTFLADMVTILGMLRKPVINVTKTITTARASLLFFITQPRSRV